MNETSRMTIVEFLEARITEDEARASSGWARLGDSRWETTSEGQDFLTPSAVLAECAAKRAIIAEWEPTEAFQGYDTEGAIYNGGIEQALAHLAAVYKGHPDYRQEWSA